MRLTCFVKVDVSPGGDDWGPAAEEHVEEESPMAGLDQEAC